MHSGKKSNQSFAFKNERLSMDRRSDNKPGHARRQTNNGNMPDICIHQDQFSIDEKLCNIMSQGHAVYIDETLFYQ